LKKNFNGSAILIQDQSRFFWSGKDMEMRKNIAADTDALVALLTEAFSSQYKKKFSKDMGILVDAARIKGFRAAAVSNESSFWIIAEDAGEMLGAVRFIVPPAADVWLPDSMEAKGLVIVPRLQGQGLGQHLMDAAKKEACLRGFTHMCIRVRKEATDLRHYYEAAGCVHDSRGDQTLPAVNLMGYVYDLKLQ
jgi:predicted N-acetyltransferase YhbS